jgi:hypothetical protein
MLKMIPKSLALVLLLPTLSWAALPQTYEPDMPSIVKLEKSVRIPKEPGKKRVPLAQWVRYYAGQLMWGRRVIAGTYVLTGRAPGIYIVKPNQLPTRAAPGCDIVHVLYDVDAKRLGGVYCNGAQF